MTNLVDEPANRRVVSHDVVVGHVQDVIVAVRHVLQQCVVNHVVNADDTQRYAAVPCIIGRSGDGLGGDGSRVIAIGDEHGDVGCSGAVAIGAAEYRVLRHPQSTVVVRRFVVERRRLHYRSLDLNGVVAFVEGEFGEGELTEVHQ